MGNDQEIEFQEIEIGIFQEIESCFYQEVEIIVKWSQEIELALGALRGLG